MLQHRGYTENCLCKQGNTVIRYLEVDFTFGLPDYVRYIEEFVISRFYSIHYIFLFHTFHSVFLFPLPDMSGAPQKKF